MIIVLIEMDFLQASKPEGVNEPKKKKNNHKTFKNFDLWTGFKCHGDLLPNSSELPQKWTSTAFSKYEYYLQQLLGSICTIWR